MKIAEVKNRIANHSEEQLKLLITEIYKAIPKAIKESMDIDSIIINPDQYISGKKSTRKAKIPDIASLRVDTEAFIEDAKNQFYYLPNQFVSKKERPKWRFTVKRLYNELFLASQNSSNLAAAAELLEKLYNLMCYSCHYIIFKSYDSFESIGIEQKDFFNRVLFLNYQIEPQRTFINHALRLMNDNSLNRYTLYATLIHVILSFLKSSDMLEMAIEESDKLLRIEKEKEISALYGDYSKYNQESNINNLAEFGFVCFVKLCELNKAIDYYKQNCIQSNDEIALFVLLKLLFSINEKDLFLREYESAIQNGVKPRTELVNIYEYIKKTGRLPKYFGWIRED